MLLVEVTDISTFALGMGRNKLMCTLIPCKPISVIAELLAALSIANLGDAVH